MIRRLNVQKCAKKIDAELPSLFLNFHLKLKNKKLSQKHKKRKKP